MHLFNITGSFDNDVEKTPPWRTILHDRIDAPMTSIPKDGQSTFDGNGGKPPISARNQRRLAAKKNDWTRASWRRSRPKTDDVVIDKSPATEE
jgi:hypothetical protein